MPRLRSLALAAALAVIAAHPAPAADIIFFPPCTGDCDGDWQVDVPELVTAVSVVLGDSARTACPSVACADDGSASVACVVTAVDNAIHDRCQPPPPDHQPCGDVLCPPGEVCCNPLYSLCTPPGLFCIQ